MNEFDSSTTGHWGFGPIGSGWTSVSDISQQMQHDGLSETDFKPVVEWAQSREDVQRVVLAYIEGVGRDYRLYILAELSGRTAIWEIQRIMEEKLQHVAKRASRPSVSVFSAGHADRFDMQKLNELMLYSRDAA